jgi:hypothetical protein
LRQPCSRRTLKRSSSASGLKTLSTRLGAGALVMQRYYLYEKILFFTGNTTREQTGRLSGGDRIVGSAKFFPE